MIPGDPDLPAGATLAQINGVEPTRMTFRRGFLEREDDEPTDDADNRWEPRDDIDN